MLIKKWSRFIIPVCVAVLLLSACKSAVNSVPPASQPEEVVAVADDFMRAISQGDHHRSYEMLSKVALENVGSYAGWTSFADPFTGIEWEFKEIGFSRLEESDAFDNLAALNGSGMLGYDMAFVTLGLVVEDNVWKVEAIKITLSN